MKYIEISHAKRHSGIAIPISDIGKHIKISIDKGMELYRSIWEFDKKILAHFGSGRKSASGFIGNYSISSLILDIDKGKDSDKFVHHRAKMFLEKLYDYSIDEDNVVIWYSGTGYHFQIPDIFGFEPSNTLPYTVKATLEKSFPEADTTFYNPAGLIRVGYTINQKSNKYKIPLTYEEFFGLSYEEIMKLAENPRTDLKLKIGKPSKLFPEYIIKKETNPSKGLILNNTNSKQVTKRVTCMQKCFNEGEKEGTRHLRIMVMASWLHRTGIPIKGAIAMLREYTPSLDKYELEKAVTDVYNKDYQFGCDNSVMKEFCDSNCVFYKHKNYKTEIKTSEDMTKELITLARGDKSKWINIADYYNIPHEFWIRPGHIVTFIGGSGRNKTTFLQNFINQLKGTKTLYVSTEFGGAELLRRGYQQELGWSREEVMEYFKENDVLPTDKLNHVSYLDKGTSFQYIENLVKDGLYEILVLDTIHEIKYEGYREGIEKEQVLMASLKNLAEKYKVIIFLVQHISKGAAQWTNPKTGEVRDKRLTMLSGLGSSSFTQKADVLLGIEGNPVQTHRIVRALKSRDNKPFEIHLEFDETTFKLIEIEPEIEIGEQNAEQEQSTR